jgi:predicted RNA-binding Zn-ribbon protein involved in translation (DUF1610 family)
VAPLYADSWQSYILRPTTAIESASYRLRLQNKGNAPVPVTLDASDPDELLTFEFDRPALTLGRGEAANVQLLVSRAQPASTLSASPKKGAKKGCYSCGASIRRTIEGEGRTLMECPGCGSTNVQTLAMVYQSGTSTVETTSRSGPQTFSGFSVGSGASWSSTSGTLSGATTTTTGTSTTDLARKAAPPRKATSGWLGIGCLTLLVGVGGGILIAAIHNDKVGQTISGLVFLGSLCVGFLVFIVMMRRAIRYNRTVLPGLLARWSRLWMCLACGRVFEPAASPPASPP